MRQKHKRVRLRYGPILWVLLILNVAFGLARSPMTAVRRVPVVGVPDWDQARVAGIVQRLQGVPCLAINPYSVESAVMDVPAVENAHLSRNLFGSARLQVSYRRPVARLHDHPDVALSDEGVLYKLDPIPTNLPLVQLLDGEETPTLTMAATWPVLNIARLAEETRDFGPQTSIRIQLQSGGRVCLNIGAGRVILGSCENLDGKLAVLRRELARDHALLFKIDSLDLTVPTAPSVVPKQIRVLK